MLLLSLVTFFFTLVGHCPPLILLARLASKPGRSRVPVYTSRDDSVMTLTGGNEDRVPFETTLSARSLQLMEWARDNTPPVLKSW